MKEVDDKVLKEIEELLNDKIPDLLYGGSGDAGWGELSGAAVCFRVLRLLGLKIKNEKSVRVSLEKDNVYNENFIDGL